MAAPIVCPPIFITILANVQISAVGGFGAGSLQEIYNLFKVSIHALPTISRDANDNILNLMSRYLTLIMGGGAVKLSHATQNLVKSAFVITIITNIHVLFCLIHVNS